MRHAFILIYVACLGGATFNHARDLWEGGWLPYTSAAPWQNAFWTSLTLIDPLAIALLLGRPRWGLALTLGLMLADVAVNVSVALSQGDTIAGSDALLAQIAFLDFILGSGPWLWQEVGKSRNTKAI